MTDRTGTEDERHQSQGSGVLPVASARRGVEHLLAEGVLTAGFARAMWLESVPVADLRLPLATVEPEQRGDRAAESGGVRRVTVTGLRVPDPPFPTTTTPARQRLSGPGPLAACGGGTPDSHRRAGESGVGPLRWARCPDDGLLHLLQPADVVVATTTTTTAGHAQTLCGRPLPAEGLTLTHCSSGALCMTCITGITPHQQKRQPDEHRPRGPRPAPGQDPPHRRAADRRSTSPEVTPTMPTRPYDPWADADGTPILQQCRIPRQRRTP